MEEQHPSKSKGPAIADTPVEAPPLKRMKTAHEKQVEGSGFWSASKDKKRGSGVENAGKSAEAIRTMPSENYLKLIFLQLRSRLGGTNSSKITKAILEDKITSEEKIKEALDGYQAKFCLDDVAYILTLAKNILFLYQKREITLGGITYQVKNGKEEIKAQLENLMGDGKQKENRQQGSEHKKIAVKSAPPSIFFEKTSPAFQELPKHLSADINLEGPPDVADLEKDSPLGRSRDF